MISIHNAIRVSTLFLRFYGKKSVPNLGLLPRKEGVLKRCFVRLCIVYLFILVQMYSDKMIILFNLIRRSNLIKRILEDSE